MAGEVNTGAGLAGTGSTGAGLAGTANTEEAGLAGAASVGTGLAGTANTEEAGLAGAVSAGAGLAGTVNTGAGLNGAFGTGTDLAGSATAWAGAVTRGADCAPGDSADTSSAQPEEDCNNKIKQQVENGRFVVIYKKSPYCLVACPVLPAYAKKRQADDCRGYIKILCERH